MNCLAWPYLFYHSGYAYDSERTVVASTSFSLWIWSRASPLSLDCVMVDLNQVLRRQLKLLSDVAVLTGSVRNTRRTVFMLG